MFKVNNNKDIITTSLTNISRSKGNRTMKFGQLMEHNKQIIFLQKSYKKLGWETSSWPVFVFLKSFVWGKSKGSVV